MLTRPEMEQIVRTLADQGWIVESADPATGRLTIRVPRLAPGTAQAENLPPAPSVATSSSTTRTER